MVAEKLSQHHNGEREVYCAYNTQSGKKFALTVFNLKCKRYEVDGIARKRQPDFIEEVRFLTSLGFKCKNFVHVEDTGIYRKGSQRLGWMVQDWIQGDTLASEINRLGVFSKKDMVSVMNALAEGIAEIRNFTHGGGHYGLTTDNLLVDYDYDEDCVKGVHIIGLTNIGCSYNGNTPFPLSDIDNRFVPAETKKGIFNHLTDIYSMGMIMGMMLCDLKGHKMKYGDGIADENGDSSEYYTPIVDPTIFRDWMVKNAEKNLSGALRLIWMKATNPIPNNRFQLVEKFNQMLNKLDNIKSATFSEERHSVSHGNQKAKLSGLQLAETEDANQEKACSKQKTETERVSLGLTHKGLDEVAGMSDLKSVLRRNFVDIVKNRQMARMYGITPPNGILLYGAPGCGKTFVAEKAAQESGLKYKIINPSDFASIYIHGSQGKIAEAFKEAEKNAPMILIFDEFDAIAPKRDADNNNQANEVNEILTQLNNCASKGIFVLATTNRPDMIDAACLRAGRMDEKFYVGLPDTDARKEIFAMELKKRPCDSDIDLELLGNATSDFTCGDISYVVKETARRCFDEALRNGDGNAVPLTTEKLMEVAKNTIPSVSPKDIRLYQELKDKMEHRDKENKSRTRVGFSTNS